MWEDEQALLRQIPWRGSVPCVACLLTDSLPLAHELPGVRLLEFSLR